MKTILCLMFLVLSISLFCVGCKKERAVFLTVPNETEVIDTAAENAVDQEPAETGFEIKPFTPTVDSNLAIQDTAPVTAPPALDTAKK